MIEFVMSRICDLTGTRRMHRNTIAIERSKITKRTKGFAQVNLQRRKFETENLGKTQFKISNRTMRTIEKHGGLEQYIVNVKRGHLTTEAKQLRKKIYNKIK
jgi:large subunit ribosomal protein L28